MKKFIAFILLFILPITLFAETDLNDSVEKVKEKGIDERIDEVFSSYTGWFVKGIFYSIPLGDVKTEEKIFLNLDTNAFSIESKGDNYIVSKVKMSTGHKADSLSSEDGNLQISGGTITVPKSYLANNEFMVTAMSPKWKIPWVLIVLIGGALFFTFYFKFINFTKVRTAINIVRGKFDSLEEDGHVEVSESVHVDAEGDNPDTIRIEGEHGEVSHFQALTAALSATVGLGNIAGVAVALSLGGPGATFWMIVAGMIGMASKFTECTLGVKYREIDEKGTVFGGPMYYLKKGLAELKMAKFGKVLAILFAVMCIGGSFGGGNMFQVNQAFEMFQNVTGGEESFVAGYGWVFGIIMAVLVGIVIIGGIKKIAKVTDKIVPIMVGIYAIAVIIVLAVNFEAVPAAFKQIFSGAFGWQAVAGGTVGVLIQGFKRAAFSNEAGIGSASIAHSAVKTKNPASEGLVALLEPFIDTVIVCTLTALVLIIANMNGDIMTYGDEVGAGVKATSDAFAETLSWFPFVLAVAVILFAFSSMISWSYYGYQAWSFLFGRSKVVGNIYRILFCVFVVVGASISIGSVIDFSDAMIFAMLVPNIIGLIFLAPKAKEELKKYTAKIKASKTAAKS